MGASIETSRLNLRWLDANDAGFILQLLNDADWLHYIGDKNVANPEQAKTYIENGPRAMYRQQGFGEASSEARFSSRQKNSDGTKTGIPRSVPYRPRNLTHVTEITNRATQHTQDEQHIPGIFLPGNNRVIEGGTRL
jgi:hypothetical protein